MSTVAPFTISRTFDAPRDIVYSIYTEPVHLVAWMKPVGFTSVHAEIDLRVGGSYHYGVQAGNGMQMWGKQVYLEIVPNEKLVFIQTFSNPEGGLARHPMSKTWPLEMLATTTFEDAGDDKTLLTVEWHPHQSDAAGEATFDAARPSMELGFKTTFGALETYLKSIAA